MKSSRAFFIGMLALSWLTIPLLGRKNFIRYIPSALFICVLTKILDEFGKRKRWWRFYKGIHPLNSMDFFNFGPYFVTSLWILRFTYGKFFLYLLSNVSLHIVFIFLGLKYIKRMKILALVKLTKIQYLGINFIRALILYAFQYTIEYAKTTFYSIWKRKFSTHNNEV